MGSDDHPDQQAGRGEGEQRNADDERLGGQEADGNEEPEDQVGGGESPGAEVGSSLSPAGNKRAIDGRREPHDPMDPAYKAVTLGFRGASHGSPVPSPAQLPFDGTRLGPVRRTVPGARRRLPIECEVVRAGRPTSPGPPRWTCRTQTRWTIRRFEPRHGSGCSTTAPIRCFIRHHTPIPTLSARPESSRRPRRRPARRRERRARAPYWSSPPRGLGRGFTVLASALPLSAGATSPRPGPWGDVMPGHGRGAPLGQRRWRTCAVTRSWAYW